MKTYKVPLVWSMLGYVEIKAESEESAIELAMGPDVPLPQGWYLDDSLEVDGEICILD